MGYELMDDQAHQIYTLKSRATRLYTLLCRSVGRSVGWSVSRSVGLSVRFYLFAVLEFFEPTAPAHMLY